MLSTVFKIILTVLILTLLNGCGVIIRGIDSGFGSVKSICTGVPSTKLTEEEMRWAKIAWKYFDNNYNYSTGLVNSADRYNSASMWNVAETLAGFMAAYELGIIGPDQFDYRVSKLLCFLSNIRLFDRKVPNILYNTKTGEMVNYSNETGAIGWSSKDLGRLLIWLKIIRERYPQYGEYIDKIVLRWNYCDIIDDKGVIYSGYKTTDSIKIVNDARLGFEEYSARGFQSWGFYTGMASRFDPYLSICIYNKRILYDGRDSRMYGGRNSVVSLPYLLDGLEFRWKNAGCRDQYDYIWIDPRMRAQARNVYLVQESRYRQDKILTARTDHLLSAEPYFVYDGVFSDGYKWNTVSNSGKFYPDNALVATQAAFGFWALWDNDYTDHLIEAVKFLNDPQRGWYEGRHEMTGCYETTISLSTNAMILECLLYRQMGKIYKKTSKETYYQKQLQDEFSYQNKCLPSIKCLKNYDE